MEPSFNTNSTLEQLELLPENVSALLPSNYNYKISEIRQLPDYITAEGFSICQFEADLFVNVNSIENTRKWFTEFEEESKTTMPETKGFQIQGQKVILRELRHCIQSDKVRQKQGNYTLKKPYSSRARNIGCMATIHLRLERRNLQTTHPLEVNIKFVHNHVIHSAESLSFRRVKDDVCNKYLELFANGHSPATALRTYEDSLYLQADNEEELTKLLANRGQNPDYGYILHLFEQYRNNHLGGRNGMLMFQRLKDEVNNYNNSGQGRAIFQEYDSQLGKAYILCIVTNLMSRIHEKIHQASELCYVDASASFEPLNTSVTLLYTSCVAGALPLGIIITSDELEITLKRGMDLLKELLPPYAFFGCGPNIGPLIFLTDDSSAERNALGSSWSQSKKLLCIFHVLQAFWRWLHNAKHNVNKEHRIPIMNIMKQILYAQTEVEMENFYCKLKVNYYNLYPQLQKHVELLWSRRQLWALSFRYGLPIRGNNTNNYIECSFRSLKDIVFSRTQAYNCVQVFQFITTIMERFYERRLLGIAHCHPGHLRIAKRFLCPGWDSINASEIRQTGTPTEYLVPSHKKDNDLFYTVNTELCTCTCIVGLTGAPCKHQGAVAAKYRIGSLNFFQSLTPYDRACFAYIARVSANDFKLIIGTSNNLIYIFKDLLQLIPFTHHCMPTQINTM